jgi:hypothetical protein
MQDRENLTRSESEYLDELLGVKPVPLSEFVDGLDLTSGYNEGGAPYFASAKRSMSKRVK